MIKFNFYLQAFLCGLAALLALMLLFGFEVSIVILLLQFVTGAIQLIASLVLMIAGRKKKPSVAAHLGISISFLLAMYILWPQYQILIFIIPWMLALFFCYISYQLYLDKITQ